MVKEKQPRFLFLMETKIYNVRMQSIRIKLGFDSMLTVDPVGLSRGITLLWRKADEVEIQTYSRRHISALIKGDSSADQWFLIGFYGDPYSASREFSWLIFILPTPLLGFVLVILTKLPITLRSLEEKCEVNNKWLCSKIIWKNADFLTWGILVLGLLGPTVKKRDNLLQSVWIMPLLLRNGVLVLVMRRCPSWLPEVRTITMCWLFSPNVINTLVGDGNLDVRQVGILMINVRTLSKMHEVATDWVLVLCKRCRLSCRIVNGP